MRFNQSIFVREAIRMTFNGWIGMLRIKGVTIVMTMFIIFALLHIGYARPADAARPYSEIKVILYMTDWCFNCMQAREHLKSLGVQVVEYNVEKDKEKEWESMEKSGRRGVPVMDIEGIIIPGYIPERITGAVEMKRNQ
jgi:glutaredoxin 3